MTILNKKNYDYIRTCGESLPSKKKDMALPNTSITLDEIMRVKKAIVEGTEPLEYDMIKYYTGYTPSEEELLFVESFGFTTSEDGMEYLGLSCLRDIQMENDPSKEEGDKVSYFVENQEEWYNADKLFSFIVILSEFDLDCVKKSIEISNIDIKNDDAYLLNLLCALLYMEKADLGMTDERALAIYNKMKNENYEGAVLKNLDEFIKDVSLRLCESENALIERKDAIAKEGNLNGKLLNICNFIEFLLDKKIIVEDISNLYLNHIKVINNEEIMNSFFDNEDVNINVFLEICEDYDDLDEVELSFISGSSFEAIKKKIEGYRQLKNL